MSSHLQSNLSSALVESVIFQQNNSTIRVAFVSPLFAAFLRVDLIERFECERGRIEEEDWWRTGRKRRRLKSGGWKNCQIREGEFRGIERREMRAAGRIDREEGSHLYPSSAFESGNLEISCRMAERLHHNCMLCAICENVARLDWLSFPQQFEWRLTALKAFGHVFIGIVDISQSSEKVRGQREGKRAAEALLCHIHTCILHPPLLSYFPLSICPYHNIKYQPTTTRGVSRLYFSPSTFVFFTSFQT